MIQIQDWKCDKKIVVVDEVNHVNAYMTEIINNNTHKVAYR